LESVSCWGFFCFNISQCYKSLFLLWNATSPLIFGSCCGPKCPSDPGHRVLGQYD
jgi:hypothetical protein